MIKINNLSRFKMVLVGSIVVSSLIWVVIVVCVSSFIWANFDKKEKILQLLQISSINHSYQSTLAEQLSIIASSETFINYIRSGAKTRSELYIDFLSEISTLHDSALSGIAIYDIKKSIFRMGKPSPYYIDLNLCYLNTQLNSKYGSCYNHLRLYFDQNKYVAALQKFNPNIVLCKKCHAFNLMPKHYFGNFPVVNRAPMPMALTLKNNAHTFSLYLIASGVLLTFLLLVSLHALELQKIVNRFIYNPLSKLSENLKKQSSLDETPEEIQEIQQLKYEIKNYQKKENMIQIGHIAAQVAHDIRSPLAVLGAALSGLVKLPEDERILIRNATTRINDIANNLLLQYQQKEPSSKAEVVEPVLISSVLDALISEKRLQFSKKKIEIICSIADEAYGLFAKVDAVQLKRAISNLMNNAAEAIADVGTITVTLAPSDHSLALSIADTGCGISAEILPKVLQGGVSFGKTSGSGIGLANAVHWIESWGGTLEIRSIVKEGTTITILLPISEEAYWFGSRILLPINAAVVILDDDLSIHHIWEKRFQSFTAENKVHLMHFQDPKTFSDWVQKNQNEKTSYLMDCELIGHAQSGLDLVESLNIAPHAFLVTSQYEDAEVRKRAETLKLRIIPKSFSIHVPIKIFDIPEYVLLDNDKMLTMSWELAAFQKNKKLLVCNSIPELFSVLSFLKQDTIFYIDSDLGVETKGEMVAKELYEKGFRELYLTTGHSASYFPPMPWIKNILGKQDVFSSTLHKTFSL